MHRAVRHLRANLSSKAITSLRGKAGAPGTAGAAGAPGAIGAGSVLLNGAALNVLAVPAAS
jgi:hypothetical protein